MAEHMRHDPAGLEAALVDLATVVDFPATPPIAEAVTAQIRDAQVGEARRPGVIAARRWWSPRLRVGRGLALGILAALFIAGVALGMGIALGGLRIVFSTATPSPLSSIAVRDRAFGRDVGLDEANRRAGFAIRVPELTGIGQPDHVFYLAFPAGGTVSLVWGDRPGYPADPRTGIGLVVTEFRADVGPEYWEKLVNTGTRVEETSVGGSPAYWVAGGNHFFFFVDANGVRVDTTIRLVGTALVWEQGGLTMRVEGAVTLENAKRVATSVR